MHTGWKGFVEAFPGSPYAKVAAIVILPVCAFFALAPDEWIMAVLPLPWTAPALAISRAIFLIIGAGAAVVVWRYYKATTRG